MFGRGGPRASTTTARVPAPRAPMPVVTIGRQAIFDGERRLYGYELLFRAAGTTAADLASDAARQAATTHVVSAAFSDFGKHALGGGLPLFINLTRAYVTGELPMLLGPRGVVLELTEDIPVDEEVLAGMVALREQGYLIAVDDFEGEEDRWACLPHADFVKLVLDAEDRGVTGELLRMVREHAPRASIVVEKIEDEGDYLWCLDQGVDLLQGFWLEHPQTLSVPSLDPQQSAALRLVAALSDVDVSVTEIERLVLSDVGLSLKVLRASSSAASSPISAVTSVRQAIVMLGPRALASWMTLTVLGGSFSPAQRQSTLTFVLARAGACARLCAESPHVAYTVGLLSGTADALGVAPAAMLETVRVHEDVTRALLHQQGPAGLALAAVISTEAGARAAGAQEVAPPEGDASSVEQRAALAYISALGEAMALSGSLDG